MTRINVGILPSELTRVHLIAELREIKRIPNCILNGRYNLKRIPNRFCLGEGHVSFFYNKLGYLRDRYLLLYNEGISRGLNITNYIGSFDQAIGRYPELGNGYSETDEDRVILINRLKERDFESYKGL